jgi:hypothetical protein
MEWAELTTQIGQINQELAADSGALLQPEPEDSPQPQAAASALEHATGLVSELLRAQPNVTAAAKMRRERDERKSLQSALGLDVIVSDWAEARRLAAMLDGEAGLELELGRVRLHCNQLRAELHSKHEA